MPKLPLSPDTLADRLLTARALKRWTRVELAERAGVPVHIVVDIERGRTAMPAYDRLQRIAAALGMDPDVLAYGRSSAVYRWARREK